MANTAPPVDSTPLSTSEAVTTMSGESAIISRLTTQILESPGGKIESFFNCMGISTSIDDLVLLLTDVEEFKEPAKDSFSHNGTAISQSAPAQVY